MADFSNYDEFTLLSDWPVPEADKFVTFGVPDALAMVFDRTLPVTDTYFSSTILIGWMFSWLGVEATC